ncbi:MAG: 30S ribosomal protein S2 [Patescibacteria group bacterium]|nr:30S ribosomal protein S2 [Patescibacteria group bacterium]
MANLIERLFAAGAHFGYAPRYRHPGAAQFLFGQKGGVEIFDLEQTAARLEEALAFIKGLAQRRGTILFVGGQPQARAELVRTAERLNMPYSMPRWIGGTLTNWGEIKKRLARLADITTQREKGELAKFTKRERLLMDREAADLELMFGGLRSVQKLPDALFVIDPRHYDKAVEEARKLGIPVIALMNSDCDSSVATYPIPGNDASREAIALVLGEVATTYSENLGAAPLPAQAGAPVEPQKA